MILSPAKVNLGLSILYKRPDGYHEIDSIFLNLNWGDEMSFEVLPEGQFSLHSELDLDSRSALDFSKVSERGDVQKNILYKTWIKAREMGCKSGVKIFIKKKIPTGAGLGGGSSNAASLFRFLFPEEPGSLDFFRTISGVGADVPFFWKGTHQRVRGIGEILEDVSLPCGFGLLALPGIVISTKEAFVNLKKTLHEPPTQESWTQRGNATVQFSEWEEFRAFFLGLKNDFEPYALSLHGELRVLRDSMDAFGFDYVSMSGTGSSFYGLTSREELVMSAFEELSQRFPSYRFVRFRI